MLSPATVWCPSGTGEIGEARLGRGGELNRRQPWGDLAEATQVGGLLV